MTEAYHQALAQIVGLAAQGGAGDPDKRAEVMSRASSAGVEPEIIEGVNEIVRLQLDFKASQK